jgi:hypothetical protein
MWTQYFTCKACQKSVSRTGPDPLDFFDYCLRCEHLELVAEALEVLAVRDELAKRRTVGAA